ncbi:MAG: ribosome biogenesis GTPase Der [Spirochaetales bacterium]|nr:ribosome biogenesis GTPase Der [Spirochaetales bacterium]
MKCLTSSQSRRKPVLAIAGRPNVGKSTLFNRLIGKNIAITDPTPGVTRDPVEYDCCLDGVDCLLVDTGGYKLDAEVLDDLVVAKSLEQVARADYVVFLLDVTAITPEDLEFAEKLRPYSHKVMVVVNKVDNAEREQGVWDFYSLGFEKVHAIAATHNIGIADLVEMLGEELRCLGISTDEVEEEESVIKISVLGQPNTGKSTLVNALLGRQQSIVSDIAGTTRDIVASEFVWHDQKFRILDTAGIRRKKKVSDNVEYYSVNRAIKSIDDSDIVILAVDSIKNISDQDKKISALAARKGKGIIIALTKWDTMEDIPNLETAVTDRVHYLFPVLSYAPVVPIAAIENKGLKRLLKTIVNVYKQLNTRVETAALNKALEEWKYFYPIPARNKTSFKAKYITQVKQNPVIFLMFINKHRGFPEDWLQYLKNRIRKEFGLTSIPIEVFVKCQEKDTER